MRSQFFSSFHMGCLALQSIYTELLIYDTDSFNICFYNTLKYVTDRSNVVFFL